MKEFIIKTFFKHKAVIIKMVDEAGHIRTHWAIPEKDNVVKLIGVKKAVVLTKESMLLSTRYNVPTFLVNYKNCEPIDVKNINKGIYGTAEFRLVVDNDMADKVFKATHSKKLSDEGKMIILVIIISVMSLGYWLNIQLQDIKAIIPQNPIVEVIEEV